MYEIRHRVGMNAPRTQVLEKLTTIDGLASWWTRDTKGDPSEGGDIATLARVAFGVAGPPAGQTVDRRQLLQHLRPRCVHAHPVPNLVHLMLPFFDMQPSGCLQYAAKRLHVKRRRINR